MDFYGNYASPPCRAVLMTAKAIGIELNIKSLDMKSGEHLKPEFLKINPQHTIPTLVDNGFAMWESRAIMIYLVEKYGKDDSLFPKCPKKHALVNQRLYFDMSLYTAFGAYYYPQVMKKAPADAELQKKFDSQMEFLNTFLAGQTYVAGDALTVADISLLAAISTMVAFTDELNKYDNIKKWYEHCKQVTPGFAENWEGCLALKKYVAGL